MEFARAILSVFCDIAIIFLLPFIIAIAWIDWGIRQCFNHLRPESIEKRRGERPAKPPRKMPLRRPQSFFFKLPRELWDMVYKNISILPTPFHIWRAHRRLCSRPCIAKLHGIWANPARSVDLLCRLPIARDGSVQRRSSQDLPCQERFLPLLSSCQRTYSETIGLLYTTNKFFLNDHRTLGILPRAIPALRLDSIRFLCLQINVFRGDKIDREVKSLWPQVCAMLPGMDRLEDLFIALGSHVRKQSIGLPSNLPILPLLNPLLKVTATSFRVQIPPGCRLSETIGGDEQSFSIEGKVELGENCNCCLAVRPESSLPFPPSP
ncbi:hypothetical protein BDW62DRAFT_220305 [Aspergillus aurantiobrunneus]